ncbi:uncharacterized protein ACLA_038880 [Aspergillus clavatus NRRL 1]|uniref:Uncharacterized protein n=1 Tax=Aspergillus clavatus (strain ATCC 1007 / CBS 513.65 / DSM 816 / NCTC 3887 / NRRL 1 / QM 1276 / 107) TaxID=344612 RepID=A1CKJ9_ASPCL|nr:uncharacterized protein ACLA_038880 [Aspergillus clavatus NRRL 1]EAW09673.1 hypothetical protein ACLA_038880 [Aspergillus clavatus NRRL 1]
MHSYASLLCLFVGYVPWSPWGFIHGAVAFQADPIGMRYEAAEAGEALWMAKRQDLQVTRTGDAERPYGVDGNTFDCQKQLSSCMSVSSVQATAADPGSDKPASGTESGPASQTTIPYDDEFDLVCDL